jgi:hydrogenase-4 component F
MAVLLVIIFVGFLNHFRTMYFENGEAADQTPAPVSAWCLLPMWLALAPLLIMGVWWPPALWDHFQTIAQALQPAHLAEAAR